MSWGKLVGSNNTGFMQVYYDCAVASHGIGGDDRYYTSRLPSSTIRFYAEPANSGAINDIEKRLKELKSDGFLPNVIIRKVGRELHATIPAHEVPALYNNEKDSLGRTDNETPARDNAVRAAGMHVGKGAETTLQEFGEWLAMQCRTANRPIEYREREHGRAAA